MYDLWIVNNNLSTPLRNWKLQGWAEIREVLEEMPLLENEYLIYDGSN